MELLKVDAALYIAVNYNRKKICWTVYGMLQNRSTIGRANMRNALLGLGCKRVNNRSEHVIVLSQVFKMEKYACSTPLVSIE